MVGRHWDSMSLEKGPNKGQVRQPARNFSRGGGDGFYFFIISTRLAGNYPSISAAFVVSEAVVKRKNQIIIYKRYSPAKFLHAYSN